MTNGPDCHGVEPSGLAELSRHYDSLLWTVTSLWGAAVGGLLLYSSRDFDTWLAVFGSALSVCAMYFAYTFRRLRRRVHEAMPDALRALHEARGRFLQWDAFGLIFLGLVVLWVRLLIKNERALWQLWLVLAVVAGACVGALWRAERGARRSDV